MPISILKGLSASNAVSEISRIPHNNCLVSFKSATYSKIKTPNGTVIYTDTSFNPDDHVMITGKVEKLPDRLIFDRRNKGRSGVEWLPGSFGSLKVGDTVFIERHAAMMAFGEEADKNKTDGGEGVLFADGNVVALINYQNIYFSIGEDGIVMHNGNILVMPVYFHHPKSNIIGMMPPNKRRQVYKVLNIGKPNIEYLNSKYYDPLPCEILPGDTILVKDMFCFKVENDLHNSGLLPKGVYVVQGRWVQAVVNGIENYDFDERKGFVLKQES